MNSQNKSSDGETSSEQLLVATKNKPQPYENLRRSWFNRTFSPMTEGGIRGNIFLLIVTTLGSSFFYLPFFARKVGLLSTLFMVFFNAFLAYMCSKILYLGFKMTKAKTYSECMEIILGRKIGFLSNVVIFIHTVEAVMSTWIFAYKYLLSGLLQVMEISDNSPFAQHFQYYFFPGMFLIILVVSLIGSTEKLKKISLMSIFLILYLVIVFVYLTPEYFSYYDKNNEIEFHGVIWSWFMLKVWGVTNYMFLNQYAVMPICVNTTNVSFKRITKIIRRSIMVVLVIYIVICSCGYLSLPSDSDNEIFLLRPPLPGDSDKLIMWGKILFGITLLVAVLVKSSFMLIYFEQLIGMFKDVFIQKQPTGRAIASENAQNNKTLLYLRKFVFLLIHATLTFFGIESLSKILGFVGSFVGVFEVILIPGYMFIVINREQKLVSPGKIWILVLAMAILSTVSFGAVGYSVAIDDHKK